jgi:phosphoserine phosphatase
VNSKDKPLSEKELNEVVERLMQENFSLRIKREDIKTIIRKRAAMLDGLSVEQAVTAVLNERDKLFSDLEIHKQHLKRVYKLLISDNIELAKKELDNIIFNK